jgi:hypothetical protein
MDGRERRKYAIQNRGLCLLISYTDEIIQQARKYRQTPKAVVLDLFGGCA